MRVAHVALCQLLVVVLSAPVIFAWEDSDDREEREHPRLHPYARRGAPLPVGARQVPWSEYRRMVRSGAWKQLAAHFINAQRRRLHETEEENERLIRRFLAGHRDLQDLAQALRTEPVPGTGVEPAGNGNWQVTLESGERVITQGRRWTHAALAHSIRQSSRRRAQLGLYAKLYGQLPVGFLDSAAGVAPLPPSELADASLAEIQSAIALLAHNWDLAANLATPGPGVAFRGCNFEVGTSSLHGDLGYVNPSVVPSCAEQDSAGIYALFDFPNKPYLTCIRSQENRGTCHTFAVVSATEMMIARAHGVAVNLSEQDVMEHYKLLWQPDYYDDGGFASELIPDMIDNAYLPPYENRWDYNPSSDRVQLPNGFLEFSCTGPYPAGEPCSDTSPQAPLVCAVQGQWQYCAFADAGIAGGPYSLTSGASFWNPADPEVSTELVLLNLAFNNGVTLGFWDTKRFDDLSKRRKSLSDFLGFLQYDPRDFLESRGGHVVHVVGYVTNHDLQYKDPFAPLGAGGGYFIVKNSWGRCWGDGGYGYLPWAYVKARANEAAAVSAVN